MTAARGRTLGSTATQAGTPGTMAVPGMSAGQVGDDFARTLVAVGMDPVEAMRQVMAAHGSDGAKGAWLSMLAAMRPMPGDRFVAFLDEVAATHPALANTWLNAALKIKKIQPWRENDSGIHLGNRTWVTSLPRNLRVPGSLDIRNCKGLTALPDGLIVEGGLDAQGLAIAALPSQLQVRLNCDFSKCGSLVAIPGYVEVIGHLNLEGCGALTHVQGAITAGFLDMRDCRSLESITGRLAVKNKADFSGCASLKQLPEGLHVGDSLLLMGCAALRELPGAMLVKGILNMTGTASWDGRIPDDARIATIRQGFRDTPTSEWRAKTALRGMSRRADVYQEGMELAVAALLGNGDDRAAREAALRILQEALLQG